MNTPWGDAALSGELEKLSRAVKGERNDKLNLHAFRIGQLVSNRHVDEDDARQRLIQVTDPWIGQPGHDGEPFTKAEQLKHIEHGLADGKQHPRDPAPRLGPKPGDGEFAQPGRGSVSTPPQRQNNDSSPSESHQGLTEAFWQARKPLTLIREAAWSRGRSAEAVLGVVLARLAADTAHTVKLPPIVGAPSGLSLIVALTGPSGTGKSSSKRIATDLVPAQIIAAECDDVPPGSGEGLLETMFEFETEETPDGKTRKVKRLKRHNVFTYADEGEVLAIQARRNSASTILPIIRSVFSDATLGQANASEERRRRVPGGQYVFGVVLGIQPDKAGPLFEDAGGGTPQRFLWMPTDTPVPEPNARPMWPDGPIERPRLPFGEFRQPMTGSYVMRVPDDIAGEIRANDYQRQQHGCDPLDEHTDLIRLKVAGILAVLDGRLNITLEDWQLAEVIRDLSIATRKRALAVLDHHRTEENRRRGEAQGDRELIVDAKRDEATVRKVTSAILRRLAVVGDQGEAEGKLRANALAPDQRGHFVTAIGRLVDAGKVTSEKTSRSILYKIKEGA